MAREVTRMTPEQRRIVEEHPDIGRYAAWHVTQLFGIRPTARLQWEMDDMVAAGNEAVCHAAISWNPNTGVPFSAWATIVVRLRLVDWMRSNGQMTRGGNRRHPDTVSLDAVMNDDGLDLKDLIPDPHSERYRFIEWDNLVWLLGQVPARERQIVWMSCVEDMPHVEIAKLFGIAESRVSQLIQQAMWRIRKGEHVREAA